MTKHNTPQPPDNLLRLPIHSEGAHTDGQLSGGTAPVLDFRKPDTPGKTSVPYKSRYELTYTQKIVRIVDAVIERLSDDQLDSLLTAVEQITGYQHQDGGPPQ
jgi:hypothetical protein